MVSDSERTIGSLVEIDARVLNICDLLYCRSPLVFTSLSLHIKGSFLFNYKTEGGGNGEDWELPVSEGQ